MSNVCRSFRTCVGSPSASVKSSGFGASAGSEGRPSCNRASVWSLAKERWREGRSYFRRNGLHSLPFHPREDVANKGDIEVKLDLLELCFFGVERECRRGWLARLACARQEVEGQKLHVEWCLASGCLFNMCD